MTRFLATGGNVAAQTIPFAESVDCPQSPIMFPVGIRSVSWQTRAGDYIPIESHRALVRVTAAGSSPRVLNVVSDTYKLVHNRELFGNLHEAIVQAVPEPQLKGAYCVDAAAAHGRTCIRQYMFPAMRCNVRDGKSRVAFRLIVQNGYGGSALRIHAGAIDFYCTNGMVRGEFESAYRRHTSGLVVERITDVVRSAIATYTDASGIWAEWAKRRTEREATMQMFRDFANSDALYERLVDRWLYEREDRGDTLWAAYSTLTRYASHVDEGEFAIRSGDPENRSTTQLAREVAVSRFIQTDEWKKLETA